MNVQLYNILLKQFNGSIHYKKKLQLYLLISAESNIDLASVTEVQWKTTNQCQLTIFNV